MGAPAYWNGHVYYFQSDDYLNDYAVQNGRLSDHPVCRGTTKDRGSGTQTRPEIKASVFTQTLNSDFRWLRRSQPCSCSQQSPHPRRHAETQTS